MLLVDSSLYIHYTSQQEDHCEVHEPNSADRGKKAVPECDFGWGVFTHHKNRNLLFLLAHLDDVLAVDQSLVENVLISLPIALTFDSFFGFFWIFMVNLFVNFEDQLLHPSCLFVFDLLICQLEEVQVVLDCWLDEVDSSFLQPN